MYYVYAHKHPLSGKYHYIGCGLEKRLFAKNRKPDHCIWLEDLLLKHDIKDIVVVLMTYETKAEALAKEKELIKEYKPEFNLLTALPMPEEQKSKISNTLSGVKHTEERKRKISEGTKKAMKRTEVKANIAKSREGITLSEEHKANISKGLKLAYEKGVR